jgi:teichuronic acid biosynthesis glycosyltransferase TuaC
LCDRFTKPLRFFEYRQLIRALTLTTLFPNSVQPAHGIFVRQRLQHLVATHDISIRVIAPVPWYPPFAPGPAEYVRHRAVPAVETVGPFVVSHPRYLVLPRIGMSLAPTLMAASLLPAIHKVIAAEPRFDLIDAHYFYPDGVAAAWLADKVALPFVITARGTDINLIPKYALPRRQILWASGKAAAIITVCDALRDELIGLGVAPSKITTLRNGYDPQQFHPVDRAEARAELRVAGKTLLLSVGHLIERKGHHIVIESLASLPDFSLIIVGTGGMEQTLKVLVQRLGLGNRVRFDGAVEQARLKRYYSACDALVLASSREGMANVLIESIACGCPVIAPNSWGTPEVVRSAEAGVLVDERSAAGFERGIRELFGAPPDRLATVRYAEQFRWEPTSAGQFAIFNAARKNATPRARRAGVT